MTREYWLKKVTEVKTQVLNYAASKLALTNRQVTEMWKEMRYWCDQCPHETQETGLEVYQGQDELDSWHTWYYRVVRCTDCFHQFEREYVANFTNSLKRLEDRKLLYTSIIDEARKLEK